MFVNVRAISVKENTTPINDTPRYAAKLEIERGETKYHGKYHRDIWLE
jgi:hypothetical protein